MSIHLVKNTGFLYIRMFITILITLYTSRVLLKELGIDDFGLYSIVGGVVAMFSSLRGVFASSIQRFLNYEIGLNRVTELQRIFSMGILIHICICVLFFFLAEIVGLWFLNNKLVISPERLNAAHWVLQFSILASIVTIMTIPYDAVIIANEKMSFFAYISILDALLKLGIVFVVSWFDLDKLKLYAILVFIVAVLVRFLSLIYCKYKFPVYRYVFFWDVKMFKKLGSFAGWNFLGNTSFTLVNEGINVLLNVFGGTTANASRAIAYQVRSATTSFIGNIQTATNPYIVKLYAQNKKNDFYKIILFTSKISFYILLIISLPIFFYAKKVLKIWLGIVPENAVSFVQLILIFMLIRVFHGPLDSLFKAVGKIKSYQIVDSLVLMLSLPVSYVCLKLGIYIEIVFIIMILVEIINLIAILFVAKRVGKLNLMIYLKKVIFPCLLVSILSCIICFFIYLNFVYEGILGLSFCFLIMVISTCLCVWSFGVNKKEKESIFNILLLIKQKVCLRK